jgi:glucosamine--fructose-6-phosphate aminotransferase (isomerizing)
MAGGANPDFVDRDPPVPGAGMAADIAEQPEVWASRLQAGPLREVAKVAAAIARRAPRQVIFTARGTSDHAALYGTYLAEIRLGLPASLANPSAITLYRARPRLRDALVVGVSQSGGSADLVEVVTVARQCGALTVALTNSPQSPLAAAADLQVDLSAGVERAVAATKSYTAQLLTLALLLEGIRGGTGAVPATQMRNLHRLPELARHTLLDPAPVDLAQRYRFADRLVTTGRGYAYATAREAALKVMETSYLAALAFSGADLLHGPVALAAPDVPVLAVVGTGPGGDSMRQVLARLGQRSADVVTVGPAAVPGYPLRLATPEVDERYSPLLDILPLQRLAHAVAVLRGQDPDTPRGLSKVTITR